MTAIFGAIFVLASLASGTQAQKINATIPTGFTEFEQEVKQRQNVNYTGFVFDLVDLAQVHPREPPNSELGHKDPLDGPLDLLVCLYPRSQMPRRTGIRRQTSFKTIHSWRRFPTAGTAR